MVTYLYCVLTAADGGPSVVGLGEVPVRALYLGPRGPLELWVATIDEATLQTSGRALGAQALAHNDVVSAALATGRTPIPARFGMHFPDDAACMATLESRAPQLRSTLARLAGTVEMSVILSPSRLRLERQHLSLPTRGEPFAGRRYLETVRARARHDEATMSMYGQLIVDVSRAVRAITRDESGVRTGRGIVSIAHLLRREDESRYRDAVRAVTMPNDVHVIVAGPRAPYNFAGPSALDIGHDSGSPDHNG